MITGWTALLLSTLDAGGSSSPFIDLLKEGNISFELKIHKSIFIILLKSKNCLKINKMV